MLTLFFLFLPDLNGVTPLRFLAGCGTASPVVSE
jgi:hypothetical protein